ncbi:hypothetical protein CCAX7_56710 [Capsulimonas corticalis]|uniref:Uncharacterized protein n=1 Tax=Capsulimonas corticalis TaxID=2219043 RepID=A0A402D0K8_9BACT|nr:ankyrin repeat domain-containing protein [Capsulimonas corticalis]BDI33620.1 hypothetical protein CCAX7_56710 [Capsulimonas corticalis]
MATASISWREIPLKAAKSGDYSELADLLARGADPNETDGGGYVPLAHAASWGRLEMAQMLLAAGADVRAESDNTAAPLYYSRNAAVSELLLDLGAEVDAITRKVNGFNVGRTALMRAAAANDLEVMRLLLSRQANPNLRDEASRTALQIAAARGHQEIVEALLASGATVGLTEAALLNDEDTLNTLMDREGDPKSAAMTQAFLAAVESSSPQTLACILKRDIDLDAPTRRCSETALILAVRKERVEIVSMLLAHGAVVDAADSLGETALHFALSPRNTRGLELAALLLDAGADVNRQSHRPAAILRKLNAPDGAPYPGTTPLMQAAATGNAAITRLLLRHHANPNLRDHHQRTALQIAAGHGRQEVVALLIAAGASVGLVEAARLNDEAQLQKWIAQETDPQSAEMAQAFWYAAGSSSVSTIALMLERGVPVDSRYAKGMTPLMRAAGQGRDDICRLLLAHGADVNAVDSIGATALHASHKHSACMRLLLEAGADIQRIQGAGPSLLGISARHGTAECVSLLIEAGVSVNRRSQAEWSPLMRAATFGKTDIVRLLIDAGADLEGVSEIDEEGYGGWTALQIAITKSHANVVQVLLDAGANIHNQGQRSETPLTNARRHAAASGDTRIVDMLVSASADK